MSISFRPFGSRSGAWNPFLTSVGGRTYVGLAMRLCIDIGLHRKGSTTNDFSLQAELKKRAFWTTYCLDRQVSIALGRPFAISDRDIDAEVCADPSFSSHDY